MLSRRFAAIVTLVIVVAFVVVAVAPAFAATPGSLVLHARLTSTAPKDGATVKTATKVVLTFNEDVNPNFVAVEVGGPAGDETDGDPTTDGRTVTQPLAPDLPAGEHVATYRVVSTDGHPVSGKVTFTTTAGPASASPSVTASASPTPSATASVVASPTPTVASPQPTVTSAPASEGTGPGISAWLLIAVVAVLAALGLGVAWRTIGGPRADAEAGAAGGPDPSDAGRPPTA
jgi:methionine-rich copper-binding protein CopC